MKQPFGPGGKEPGSPVRGPALNIWTAYTRHGCKESDFKGQVWSWVWLVRARPGSCSSAVVLIASSPL